MIETQAETTYQTAGERLFPSIESLKSRMLQCGVTPSVTEFLAACRENEADRQLSPPQRQLLEACTLTTAMYQDIAVIGGYPADDLDCPAKIAGRLKNVISALFRQMEQNQPGSYNRSKLQAVKIKGQALKVKRKTTAELEHNDPAIFICEGSLKSKTEEDESLDYKIGLEVLGNIEIDLRQVNQKIFNLKARFGHGDIFSLYEELTILEDSKRSLEKARKNAAARWGLANS